MYTTLISTEQLLALQASTVPLALFDCSFELMNPSAGAAQFAEVHIAGARHADLDRHLSTHSAERASGGRHPLPTREAFTAWVGAQGVTPQTQVVVYDRQGANYCGRLWWMLKWIGHEAVAVLDGGLAAWQAAGGPVVSGASPHTPKTSSPYPLGVSLAAVVSAHTLAAQLGSGQHTVVDARAPARYRGEVEPLDPVAGHIPGALNRPFTSNIGADGRFKPAAELRMEFEALLGGRDPATVVHQCGSGVSAIPNLLAMEIAGLGRSALFPGSWSEWCNTPGLPVAKG
jgi:thiosulfate/3-mercaptopyruvate sulfurtransferase